MQVIADSLYNSATSVLNPELDMFLLPILHKEPIPPKTIFLISSSKPITQSLHRALFSHSLITNSLDNFSGLTISRILMGNSPTLLIEVQGHWDYISELIGLSLSNMIIIAMEYNEFEDFEIEKLFDIIIRLDTDNSLENHLFYPNPRNLVIYLADVPEDIENDILESRIFENFKRKWSLFPKTERWNNITSIDRVFTIEIKRFSLKNQKEYIPIGFLGKSHASDLTIGELYCIGGICEEILRILKSQQEYLYFKNIRSQCFLLQIQRIHKVVFDTFQEEIKNFKKCLKPEKIVDLKDFYNNIVNQHLSRFDIRTQGLRDSLTMVDNDVFNERKKIIDEIIKEFISISNIQKNSIINYAEKRFEQEIKKVYNKFKENKQISLLDDVKIMVLEQLGGLLNKNDIEFLINERNSHIPMEFNESKNFNENSKESNPLERLMAQFQAKIIILAEKERKEIFLTISELMNKELLKIVENALSGEDIYIGREYWQIISRKLTQCQEKYFSIYRRNCVNLSISETTVSQDINHLVETQKNTIILEFEKRKFKLDEFLIKSLKSKKITKIKEIIKNQKNSLFEKIDENTKNFMIRDIKLYCQGIFNKLEESIKVMRWMDLYEGRLWLSAEEIHLILLALQQAFDKEINGIHADFLDLLKKAFFKDFGIFIAFALISVLICFWQKLGGFYIRGSLAGVSLGIGLYFGRIFVLKRKIKGLK